jgi:cell division protein FtsZ
VVTKPFRFEQAKRERAAEQGLKALSEHVDSLIVIPNEKLIQVLGGKTKLSDAFVAANDVLHSAVSGIAEIISNPGMINVDFADVKTVMSEIGMAMMGSADAVGEERATQAAQAAVNSPLLENVDLKGARGVLVNITASDSLTLDEYYRVMETIQSFAAEEATVIVGTSLDETMGETLRVTMVATGLGNPVRQEQKKPEMRIVEPIMKATGTDDARPYVSAQAETDLDMPSVIRKGRREGLAAELAPASGGFDTLDIPALLRKQAD